MRAWLAHNVPAGAGFEVEDKRLSLALHYRNAEPAAAAALCARFEEFVRTDAPHLRAAHNKMVVEALPAAASKGEALRALGREAGAAFVPVYFGDDRTDEDAFAELLSRGVGVLVGDARPSLARWRVDSPAAVARILTALATRSREFLTALAASHTRSHSYGFSSGRHPASDSKSARGGACLYPAALQE